MSGSLPASFVPTIVISELPASEMLLTASSTMAMELLIRPITALNAASSTLAAIPMTLVRMIVFSRDTPIPAVSVPCMFFITDS